MAMLVYSENSNTTNVWEPCGYHTKICALVAYSFTQT